MNHTSCFMTMLTDEAVWGHLQALLREYDPEMEEKHTAYISALEDLSATGADATTFREAIQAAIFSDAMFAFQKGVEANLYHFYHPQVPSFAQVDYEDMHQEWIMQNMPKRLAAEKIISAIEREYFQSDLPWCETIREHIIDLEVTIPKLMHFEGYLAGNQWFALTIPGYQEDQALTSIYSLQIGKYFGK